jgi:hypothetical protein
VSESEPFIFTVFSMKVFTFSYLPLTLTGLPTYHNRSTYVISKKGKVESGIKMKQTKPTKKSEPKQENRVASLSEVKIW